MSLQFSLLFFFSLVEINFHSDAVGGMLLLADRPDDRMFGKNKIQKGNQYPVAIITHNNLMDSPKKKKKPVLEP